MASDSHQRQRPKVLKTFGCYICKIPRVFVCLLCKPFNDCAKVFYGPSSIDRKTSEKTLDFNTHFMYSTCVEDSLPVPDVSASAVTTSIQDLINAIQQIDSMLWDVQVILIRIDEYPSLAQRWQDISLRFRNGFTASKLAASSMTVLLSEYRNVILVTLVTGTVKKEVVQAEIDSLTRTVERRKTDLINGQTPESIEQLCGEIREVLREIKAEMSAQPKKWAKHKGNLRLCLSRLEAQLEKWSSKVTSNSREAFQHLGFGPFVCAPIAIMLDSALVQLAAESAEFAQRDAEDDDTSSHEDDTRTLISTRYEHEDTNQNLQDLASAVQGSSDFALKIDVIADIYSMFQYELKGLTAALSEAEDITANEEFLKRIEAVSALYNSLIKMLDLYSKETLFVTRAMAPVRHSTLTSCIPSARQMDRTLSG